MQRRSVVAKRGELGVEVRERAFEQRAMLGVAGGLQTAQRARTRQLQSGASRVALQLLRRPWRTSRQIAVTSRVVLLVLDVLALPSSSHGDRIHKRGSAGAQERRSAEAQGSRGAGEQGSRGAEEHEAAGQGSVAAGVAVGARHAVPLYPAGRYGFTRTSTFFENDLLFSSAKVSVTVMSASFLRLGRSYHTSKYIDRLEFAPPNSLPLTCDVTES
jgi:hypothetical protein